MTSASPAPTRSGRGRQSTMARHQGGPLLWGLIMMQQRYQTSYAGYRLIAIVQHGGFAVEIIPVGGGRSMVTLTFGQLDLAIASAKRIVDHQNRVLH
jgi:hypothetical protein